MAGRGGGEPPVEVGAQGVRGAGGREELVRVRPMLGGGWRVGGLGRGDGAAGQVKLFCL